MRLLDYLNEKLDPSQFRDIVKKWKDSGISHRYDDVFGNEDRIYIPYTPKQTKGLESDTEKRVTNLLYGWGWTVTDYKGGYAEKNGRTMKIGKILNNLIKEYSGKNDWNSKDIIELSKKTSKLFQSDESRSVKGDNFLIAISRHAYDVAGMSTDRGWTSCQELTIGSLRQFVIKDIKAGTIIAYLIRGNDKNINKPLGRVLLKPFYNEANDEFVLGVSKMYGMAPTDFRQTVQRWADKNFNKGKWGEFKIDPTVYQGSDIKGTKTISPPAKVLRAIGVTVITTTKQLKEFWISNEGYGLLSDVYKKRNNGLDSFIGSSKFTIKKVNVEKFTETDIYEMYMTHLRRESYSDDALTQYYNKFHSLIWSNIEGYNKELDDAHLVIGFMECWSLKKFPKVKVSKVEMYKNLDDIRKDYAFFNDRMGKAEEYQKEIYNKFYLFYNKYVL
jgi:hypothetical protein